VSEMVYLIDGSNQAYRAFHAMQADLRAPDGFPTRALYGFVRILTSLVRKHKPDYVLIVFDMGKSFRVDLLPDYKGHRPEMPDELRLQWPELAPLSEAFGYSTFAEDCGFEADDVIGTLSRAYAKEGFDVRIVSNDKDFAQLVTDKIHLFDPIKNQLMGPDEVMAKWGVPPERIVDLLSLVGDKSDNVPGIAGVGQKTAAKYINRFGSWRDVIGAADQIGGKTGARVAESYEVVELANRLVTIKEDMDLDIPIGQLIPEILDPDLLIAKLQRFGFQRFVKEMDLHPSRPAIDQTGYQLIESLDALVSVLGEIESAGRVSVDLETTSLDARQAKIVGVCLCWREDRSVYIPIGHSTGGNVEDGMSLIGPMLEDPAIKKIGQNLKYDYKVLKCNGFQLRGIEGDTLLSDYLLFVSQKHGLDALALRHLGHKNISYEDATAEVEGRFGDLTPSAALKYAAEDAHVVFLIDSMLDTAPFEMLLNEVEIPLIPILAEIELEGIGINADGLAIISSELEKQITDLTEAIHAEVGREFNLNSTKQLSQILYEERGFRPVKKTKGKTGYSTDAQTLQLLAEQKADPILPLMQKYREYAKLKGTYVDALPSSIDDDGRIRTSLHQAVTETGRLSSSHPNLQNIPIRTALGRSIRRCFVPREGHLFISADYSQIELRVLAHYCGKGALLDAFNNDADIHEQTGIELAGGQIFYQGDPDGFRRVAKAINYGLVYGMSPFRLSRDLGISMGQAQDYVARYFERYPQVREYMDSSIEKASKKGYSETLYGRQRRIFGFKARLRHEREAAHRIAMNSPIQGTAADIMKIAMISVSKRLRDDFPFARLILQIHDELLVEAPREDAEELRLAIVKEMETAVDLLVPLKVNAGVGRNWEDAH
jgi:DNA polymerase I